MPSIPEAIGQHAYMYSSEISDIHDTMSPVLSDREAHDEECIISFTSLGLLVLDEFAFQLHSVLDCFLPPPLDRSLGWMLNAGNDFPKPTRRFLESWGATLIVKEQFGKPSTRGLLEYKDITFGRGFPVAGHPIIHVSRLTQFSAKDLEYTTPILQVVVNSLKDTSLLTSEAYHFLESPPNIKS
ncbi:hypothetical protein BDW75DRAFT_12682 [Aspergillus navahoensis]